MHSFFFAVCQPFNYLAATELKQERKASMYLIKLGLSYMIIWKICIYRHGFCTVQFTLVSTQSSKKKKANYLGSFRSSIWSKLFFFFFYFCLVIYCEILQHFIILNKYKIKKYCKIIKNFTDQCLLLYIWPFMMDFCRPTIPISRYKIIHYRGLKQCRPFTHYLFLVFGQWGKNER